MSYEEITIMRKELKKIKRRDRSYRQNMKATTKVLNSDSRLLSPVSDHYRGWNYCDGVPNSYSEKKR